MKILKNIILTVALLPLAIVFAAIVSPFVVIALIITSPVFVVEMIWGYDDSKKTDKIISDEKTNQQLTYVADNEFE